MRATAPTQRPDGRCGEHAFCLLCYLDVQMAENPPPSKLPNKSETVRCPKGITYEIWQITKNYPKMCLKDCKLCLDERGAGSTAILCGKCNKKLLQRLTKKVQKSVHDISTLSLTSEGIYIVDLHYKLYIEYPIKTDLKAMDLFIFIMNKMVNEENLRLKFSGEIIKHINRDSNPFRPLRHLPRAEAPYYARVRNARPYFMGKGIDGMML